MNAGWHRGGGRGGVNFANQCSLSVMFQSGDILDAVS